MWTAVLAAPALAAFIAGVQADAALSAYTVPTPANVRCVGLGLLRGAINWNAVTPPAGNTVDYVVTQPDTRAVTTTATRYALPILQLIGQYRVQARISSGWLSAPATVNVTLGVGGVYVCS